MKKRFLPTIMALIMVLSLIPTSVFADTVANCPNGANCTEHVAAISTTHYDTLQEALTAASGTSSSYAQVKLLKDTTENVVIESGKYISLDLNRFTLSGGTDYNGEGHQSEHYNKEALTNKGRVTIVDTSTTQTGTI